MPYDGYRQLRFERREHGVLLITIDRPERLNATDEVLHAELSRVWRDVARDEETTAAVITGAGRAFSAGGDLEMIERMTGSYRLVAAMAGVAAELVESMIDCDTPIISAINGTAVGAGLAVALMADISVIGDDVRLTDGHLRLGVGAGDHAVLLWPLLCGMAKAKYYLLTSDFIDGPEAERIGLVSRCVAGERVLDEALAIAERIALGPRQAARWTKRTLNHWLRTAMPAFDASVAYEMLTFLGEDVGRARARCASGGSRGSGVLESVGATPGGLRSSARSGAVPAGCGHRRALGPFPAGCGRRRALGPFRRAAVVGALCADTNGHRVKVAADAGLLVSANRT